MRPAKVVETNQTCQAHTASEAPLFKKQLRQYAIQVEVTQRFSLARWVASATLSAQGRDGDISSL